MKNQNKVNFYIKQDTMKILDELARSCGMSRSSWLTMKILQEYDALHGNVKARETIFTLKEIKRLIDTIDVKYGK